MNAASEAVAAGDAFDFESFFHLHYERVARAVSRVVRDRARAEEIAAEAFWKCWRKPGAIRGGGTGWLYRVSMRMALDDLRRQARNARYRTAEIHPATPEHLHSRAQECERVRIVLACLDPRQSELLLLRSNDLSYSEIASATGMNPNSVGTLLSRAQQAFRKEYVKRYGEPEYER